MTDEILDAYLTTYRNMFPTGGDEGDHIDAVREALDVALGVALNDVVSLCEQIGVVTP